MATSTRTSHAPSDHSRPDSYNDDARDELGGVMLDNGVPSQQSFSSLLVHAPRMGMPPSSQRATRSSGHSQAQAERPPLPRSILAHLKWMEAGLSANPSSRQGRHSTGRSTKLPSYKEEQSRPPSLTTPPPLPKTFVPELPLSQPERAQATNNITAAAFASLRNSPEEAVPEVQIPVRSRTAGSVSSDSTLSTFPSSTASPWSRRPSSPSHPFAINNPIAIPSAAQPASLFSVSRSISPFDPPFESLPRSNHSHQSKSIHELLSRGNTSLKSFGHYSFPDDNRTATQPAVLPSRRRTVGSPRLIFLLIFVLLAAVIGLATWVGLRRK
ncbi:hypothetical protein DL93DRAFT_569546 [Clavulina sp. PMI_390]|nr:hypothetical protein DL93DRAFT_569546 [Clavulina sp. PMI_390]